MGDWRLLFLFATAIKKVTPEDVARVAKLYLKPSNLTTGKFIPDRRAGSLRDSRHARTSQPRSRIIKATPPSKQAKPSIPRPPISMRAPSASLFPTA